MKTGPEAHQTKKQPFTQKYESEIRQLLLLAGVAYGSDKELVDATQPWVRGDHFAPEHGINLSPPDEAEALRIFQEMSMVNEIHPEGGTYDRVLVLGGVQQSNESRLAYLKEQLDTGAIDIANNGKIILLGGIRPIDKATESDIPGVNTESQGLRHASTQELGQLSTSQIHLRIGLLPMGHDVISKYVMSNSDISVDVINANPVGRMNGQTRPTTESTITDWLSDDGVADGSRVLLVSSNPYIYRTTKDVERTFQKLGRKLLLEGVGPAALPELVVRRCYGELGRIIYQEKY